MELHGRRQIFTDIKDIDKDNLLLILSDAITIHEQNAREIQFLMDYEKGVQPLKREKDVRPEIDIHAQENHAAEITEFKIGYEFGSPVTYVQRAKIDARSIKYPESASEEKDDIRISLLNEMMFEENKPAKDVKLARDFKICGVGYRMFRAKRRIDGVSVFDMAIPSPLTTFVVYSNDAYREPVLGVTYSINTDGSRNYGAYTREKYFSWRVPAIGPEGVINEEPNIIGEIPIVEYVNNYDRMGCFEKVIPIMDALNVTSSDRVNDISQFVQNLLWMHNCDIDEDGKANLKDGGLIVTKSTGNGYDAKIAYVTSTLDQQGTQTLVDYQYEQILQISGTPGRDKSSGGNTGSAILLSNGWQLAETQAKSMELVFSESEKQALRVVLAIIRKSKDADLADTSIRSLRVSDVLTKFSRNKTYDLVSRVNALIALVTAGFDIEKSVGLVDITDDPLQFAIDSEETVNKIRLNQSTKQPETSANAENPVDGIKTQESTQPSRVENVDN